MPDDGPDVLFFLMSCATSPNLEKDGHGIVTDYHHLEICAYVSLCSVFGDLSINQARVAAAHPSHLGLPGLCDDRGQLRGAPRAQRPRPGWCGAVDLGALDVKQRVAKRLIALK